MPRRDRPGDAAPGIVVPVSYDYDLVVLGVGPAGEKGAAQAAYYGKRVACVETRARAGRRGGAYRHPAEQDAARDGALSLRLSPARALRPERRPEPGDRGAEAPVAQERGASSSRSRASSGTSNATASRSSAGRRASSTRTPSSSPSSRGRAAARHERGVPRRDGIAAASPAGHPVRRRRRRRLGHHPADRPPAPERCSSWAAASSGASTRRCSRRCASPSRSSRGARGSCRSSTKRSPSACAARCRRSG